MGGRIKIISRSLNVQLDACYLGTGSEEDSITSMKSSFLMDEMDTLTKRQEQVILLMIEGMQDKEIAFALGISQRTVRRRIDSIESKLKAKTRVHAVAQYLIVTLKNIVPVVVPASSMRRPRAARIRFSRAFRFRLKWQVFHPSERKRAMEAIPVKYASNEVYCLFCKSRVAFTYKHRFFGFIYGKCPKGHNVAKLAEAAELSVSNETPTAPRSQSDTDHQP